MKALVAAIIVFLSLHSSLIEADEFSYKKAIDARIDATKSYARARVLVAGISRQEKPSRKIYNKTLDKAEQHIVDATAHISRSTEHYLDGYHGGYIDESSATKLRQQLKIQKHEIAELKLYIAQMRSRSLSKVSKKADKVVKAPIVGPDGKTAEKEILQWLSQLKKFRKNESSRWKDDPVTKNLWSQAIADSGFYGIHIKNLVNSAAYVKNKEAVPQHSLDYIEAGMKQFGAFQTQLITLFEKIKSAQIADMNHRQRKVKELLRPYLTQVVFSRLPSQKAIPQLPESPLNQIGYIPEMSMMQTFSEIENRPSLAWLEKDTRAKLVLRSLYDRGLAHKFLKKFIKSGGKLSVEITRSGNSDDVEYLQFDDILYLPDNFYIDSGESVNSKVFASLVREIFHAYCKQVVQAGNDPITKQLLVNVETWLQGQFIRRHDTSAGSTAWVKYSDVIKDSSVFTQEYVGSIIDVAFAQHVMIWSQLTAIPRNTRIDIKTANQKWLNMESNIIDTQYSADQHDGEYWEVQGVPPASALKYINAFFGLGEFKLD